MASRIALRYLTAIHCAPKPVSTPLLRPHPRLPRTLQPVGRRWAHSIPRPTAQAQGAASSPSPDAAARNKKLEPHYELTFTCVPCAHRSTHVVSKQGYHKGSVLITCPGCRNRHVISDNLNIFGDRNITVEDLLREKGQLVKKGTLGEDGDIEFWQDDPIETADVGGAGAASVDGKGEGGAEAEGDEARRLREARDPSSQTTDPAPPSASILPGDTGTRPSVQSISHQSPTPSTRRQYNTKQFQPPPRLRKVDIHPKYRFKHAMGSDEHTSQFFEVQGPYNPSTPGGYDRNQMIASLRNQLRDEGDDVGNVPTPAQFIEPIRPASPEAQYSTDAGSISISPQAEQYPRPTFAQNPRKNAKVRTVLTDRVFKGIRLIRTRGDGRTTVVQVRQGVVARHRPPGGPGVAPLTEEAKLTPLWTPDTLRNFARQPSLSQPTITRKDFSSNPEKEDASRISRLRALFGEWERDPVEEEPTVRRVLSEYTFNGVRFVGTPNPGYRVAVQMRPGVVMRTRPPGGVLEEEPPADRIPDPPVNYAARRGFFRPSFLPIIPDLSPQS
ncbi:DNL zinc finger-domain-containing protein [Nemania abortiva]|nr:DNL zinc finger-domain-containing protein [Nemania abortiva]